MKNFLTTGQKISIMEVNNLFRILQGYIQSRRWLSSMRRGLSTVDGGLEDSGPRWPASLLLAHSPLDASSHSCLTLYRTWAFGWLSGRWQAMTAVFPSSTSITCCTSNLKSWRSVERREGVDGGDMQCFRVACILCFGVFSHNKQLQKLTHWGLSGDPQSPSSSLLLSMEVYRTKCVALITAWEFRLVCISCRVGVGVENSTRRCL